MNDSTNTAKNLLTSEEEKERLNKKFPLSQSDFSIKDENVNSENLSKKTPNTSSTYSLLSVETMDEIKQANSLNSNNNNTIQQSPILLMKNQINNSTLSIRSDSDENKQTNNNDSLNSSNPANISLDRQSLNNNSNNPLNEKVTTLASSIYTELEKIVKLHGRDTVKDLMPIVVNILEALDTAYQEKEELIVENELQRDDNEKLLNQYEREKQARKDTELKLFQSEDSFAEQRKEYDEKIKSLESIVRMIDLKSKNTSDHVLRLEEKETELKKEYNKLHERYTDLFKTHCDYMERTKMVFGNDGRLDGHSSGSGGGGSNFSRLKNKTNINSQNSNNTNNNNNNSASSVNSNTSNNANNNNSSSSSSENLKSLLDILKSNSTHINKNDLINALKYSTRAEINNAISTLLNSNSNDQTNQDSNANLPNNSSNASLTSLVSNSTIQNNESNTTETNINNNEANENTTKFNLDDGSTLNNEPADSVAISQLNLQSSENFDEHIASNVEFDDSQSDTQSIQKHANELDAEYEGDDEVLAKNDLSLFNELSRENYDITELDDGADLTGMTREVANLIRENSELLQTKHALNVLKDDLIARLDQFSNEMVILKEEINSLQTVKACLQLRITELEEEAKKAREEYEKNLQKQEQDDENIPMSQRKRFTRAEMARVLMERNQYKERLMDLQEAVRWTEMMRASKVDPVPGLNNGVLIGGEQPLNSNNNNNNQIESQSSSSQHSEHKKKTTLWKFFSDLFGSSQSSAMANNNNQAGLPGSSQTLPNRSLNNSSNSSPRKKSNDFEMQSDKENSNKYKDMVVIKDESRMQAYGWSLPAKTKKSGESQTTQQQSTQKSNNLAFSVPVPVYCRPLFESDTNLKLSSSSIINLSFDKDLLKDCGQLIESSSFSYFKSKPTSYSSFVDENTKYKTSCIWICNLNENDTHVSILDANKPTEILSQFTLKSIKIYCIQSVAGLLKKNEQFSNDVKSFNSFFEAQKQRILSKEININKEFENISFVEYKAPKLALEGNNAQQPVESSSSNSNAEEGKHQITLSTMYPTMWLGSQEGFLLVHSSISNVSKTLERIKLNDAVLCIIQNQEKVIVGLADGSLSIFSRNSQGTWDLKNYIIVSFDKPHHSIRTICNVYENIWCGCRNKIYVFDPIDIKILAAIEVHPRKENQVRHIVWHNDGVWVSLRLDSTLRLYHSKTYQHLQYLDIEPFITRMLGTSNLGLSLIRISSLIIGCKRLWIGTGNGVILSIPFSDNITETNIINSNLSLKPGSVVRVVNTTSQSDGNQSGMIPYCNLTDAQFSFHGHRDSIKFFLNVPSEILRKVSTSSSSNNNSGNNSPTSTEPPTSSSTTSDGNIKLKAKQESYERAETLLILSGGHGYIDFRIGDSHLNKKVLNANKDDGSASEAKSSNLIDKTDRSHLIVWQMNNCNN